MAKLYDSVKWLRLRYVVQGRSPEEMAKEAGCTKVTIYTKLREAGLMRK